LCGGGSYNIIQAAKRGRGWIAERNSGVEPPLHVGSKRELTMKVRAPAVTTPSWKRVRQIEAGTRATNKSAIEYTSRSNITWGKAQRKFTSLLPRKVVL
jgi:hypothetical protein